MCNLSHSLINGKDALVTFVEMVIIFTKLIAFRMKLFDWISLFFISHFKIPNL